MNIIRDHKIGVAIAVQIGACDLGRARANRKGIGRAESAIWVTQENADILVVTISAGDVRNSIVVEILDHRRDWIFPAGIVPASEKDSRRSYWCDLKRRAES